MDHDEIVLEGKAILAVLDGLAARWAESVTGTVQRWKVVRLEATPDGGFEFTARGSRGGELVVKQGSGGTTVCGAGRARHLPKARPLSVLGAEARAET